MTSSDGERRRSRIGVTILAVLAGWIYVYNLLIKNQGPVQAFFEIVDTLSEDVIMDSLVTVVVGCLIVVVFTATKLYTQVIAEASSFRILERIATDASTDGDYRRGLRRLLNLEAEDQPKRVCPESTVAILLSFAGMYLMSWVYLVLFSEALFFVSWSAGVNLVINDFNLGLLPTLALAIPFSARVMAYLGYPYSQDYADFMPGAVFVLLMVASLGYLFESEDQKFFLLQVWQNEAYLQSFLTSGLVLAFLPVFSEAVFWMFHLYQENPSEG